MMNAEPAIPTNVILCLVEDAATGTFRLRLARYVGATTVEDAPEHALDADFLAHPVGSALVDAIALYLMATNRATWPDEGRLPRGAAPTPDAQD
jgi:hypothetical protein